MMATSILLFHLALSAEAALLSSANIAGFVRVPQSTAELKDARPYVTWLYMVVQYTTGTVIVSTVIVLVKSPKASMASLSKQLSMIMVEVTFTCTTSLCWSILCTLHGSLAC